MKIEKFDSNTDAQRIPMARGDNETSGEKCVLSLLVDTESDHLILGLVLEFEDDEAYYVSTGELISEIMSHRS